MSDPTVPESGPIGEPARGAKARARQAERDAGLILTLDRVLSHVIDQQLRLKALRRDVEASLRQLNGQ